VKETQLLTPYPNVKYPQLTMNIDPKQLSVAEAWANERAFRLSLGNMMLRTLERLEAEFLSNRTLPSSSAALAKELRQSAMYLEDLQDRLLKHPMTEGPEQVERLLLRLNELTGQLQKLRAPHRRAPELRATRRKGIRTGGPSVADVEVAEAEEASPSVPSVPHGRTVGRRRGDPCTAAQLAHLSRARAVAVEKRRERRERVAEAARESRRLEGMGAEGGKGDVAEGGDGAQ